MFKIKAGKRTNVFRDNFKLIVKKRDRRYNIIIQNGQLRENYFLIAGHNYLLTLFF